MDMGMHEPDKAWFAALPVRRYLRPDPLAQIENTRQTTLHARCMHDLQSDGCEALYSLIQWLDVERRSCIVQKRRVYSSSPCNIC